MPVIAGSLEEALAPILDGSTLLVPRGDAGVAMEATRGLIRRGARRLSLVAVPTSGLQADLLIDHGGLTGMVTNRTGGRLSDAFIVVDGDFRPLGTLEKDQSSQIDFLLPPQAAAGNMAATAIADKLTPPGSTMATSSAQTAAAFSASFASRAAMKVFAAASGSGTQRLLRTCGAPGRSCRTSRPPR